MTVPGLPFGVFAIVVQTLLTFSWYSLWTSIECVPASESVDRFASV